MLHMACDVHTHTIFSRHAYSTIEENVRAAAELRVELLGSTDHFSCMLYPERDGAFDVRDFQYLYNLSAW
ncbi:MAG: phosphatase, partial [Coriobacteriaceae bacterium]